MTMRLIPLAASVLLAACAALTPPKEPPPKPFLGTKWQVVLDIPLPTEQPTFRFGDGRVEGYSGCNQATARITQDSIGSRFIAIGRLEVGKRLCDGNARNAETHVLTTLQNVSSYIITGDTMIMSGSAGSLKFVAVP
jgi:heat shock protein HslJ